MGERDAIKEQGNCYLEAMTQTAAITEAITTLLDAENRFGFVRVQCFANSQADWSGNLCCVISSLRRVPSR